MRPEVNDDSLETDLAKIETTVSKIKDRVNQESLNRAPRLVERFKNLPQAVLDGANRVVVAYENMGVGKKSAIFGCNFGAGWYATDIVKTTVFHINTTPTLVSSLLVGGFFTAEALIYRHQIRKDS